MMYVGTRGRGVEQPLLRLVHQGMRSGHFRQAGKISSPATSFRVYERARQMSYPVLRFRYGSRSHMSNRMSIRVLVEPEIVSEAPDPMGPNGRSLKRFQEKGLGPVQARLGVGTTTRLSQRDDVPTRPGRCFPVRKRDKSKTYIAFSDYEAAQGNAFPSSYRPSLIFFMAIFSAM